ncbi:uncharacterized protein METZ01_LOCUS303280, partial [marine metagenome]
MGLILFHFPMICYIAIFIKNNRERK